MRWRRETVRGLRREYDVDLMGMKRRHPNRPMRWRRFLPRWDWRRR
jgi:hypothetical protein